MIHAHYRYCGDCCPSCHAGPSLPAMVISRRTDAIVLGYDCSACLRAWRTSWHPETARQHSAQTHAEIVRYGLAALRAITAGPGLLPDSEQGDPDPTRPDGGPSARRVIAGVDGRIPARWKPR